MNLIVDIGNTRVKLAVFKEEELVDVYYIEYDKLISKIEFLLSEFEIDKAIVSNVGRRIEGLEAVLENINFVLFFNSSTKLPISVDYETPKTLGVDRRALAVAVNSMNPDENSLVIDMGSCITYDVITSEGVYLGGAISPGMNMRFRAMNNFTQSLPLVSFKDTNSVIGRNTEMSLVNGVIFGISSEIDGYINRLKDEFDNFSIFICGGDHAFFVDKIKNSIFADQIIVIRGLNIILNYNFKISNEETTY